MQNSEKHALRTGDGHSGSALSAEFMAELVDSVQRGDKAAATALTEACRGLVVNVAKRFRGKGVSMDDLVAEGCYGVLIAAERFDSSRGTSFTAYASRFVSSRMKAATAAEGKKMRSADERGRNGRSLADGLATDGADTMAADGLPEAMTACLAKLSERERLVLTAVYGFGSRQMTFAEAGEWLGVSRERARQICRKAMRRLRRIARDAGLTDFR